MADERNWYEVVAGAQCDECGLIASGIPQARLGTALTAEAERWDSVLTRGAEELRRRPAPEVWSALEYGAHVRDVLALFGDRIEVVIAQDRPELGWWDHEAAAIDERYNEEDPTNVAQALAGNAGRLSAVLPPPGDPAWRREGTRRGRERFTVDGLARFALHEARHHRSDAERGLGRR